MVHRTMDRVLHSNEMVSVCVCNIFCCLIFGLDAAAVNDNDTREGARGVRKNKKEAEIPKPHQESQIRRRRRKRNQKGKRLEHPRLPTGCLNS